MPSEAEQSTLSPDFTWDRGARKRPRSTHPERGGRSSSNESHWARSSRALLFEENGGLFWLRGKDLDRANSLLGLRCESPAVGFDFMTWAIQVAELAKRRVPVELVVGKSISKVRLLATPPIVPSTPIDLSPVQLVGQAEMDRLSAIVARGESRVGEFVATAMKETDDGPSREVESPLFAYQVDRDLYEVDWELTIAARSTVEALLVEAHQDREMLHCQLVPARSGRAKSYRGGISLSPIKDRIAFGQLKLPL